MALIGYARVSTAEQDTALQTDALRQAGCDKIFEDTVSGAKAERPGLAAALAYVREGDALVVWRLDRLGRSLPHLIVYRRGGTRLLVQGVSNMMTTLLRWNSTAASRDLFFASISAMRVCNTSRAKNNGKRLGAI
jgi:DNA invertase Pin-like site-specific DNA recombinase